MQRAEMLLADDTIHMTSEGERAIQSDLNFITHGTTVGWQKWN